MDKTVIELFAGVGGFHIGLNGIDSIDENGRAIDSGKWKFTWTNQWEPSTKAQPAYECLVQRFGHLGEEISNQDVTTVETSTVPYANLIVGGFPCQPFSVAATLDKSHGITGAKGQLFADIIRIAQYHQVPFMLLENVDRFLKSPASKKGRDFGVMLRAFYDVGYDLEWRVINAADYGFPQRRRRTFLFIWRRDTVYAERIGKEKPEDIIFDKGLFATPFPLEKPENLNPGHIAVVAGPYMTPQDIFDNFSFKFENSGVMLDGHITTCRFNPICEDQTTLGEIMEDGDVDQACFLNDRQNEKMAYFRASKRLLRTRADGTQWYYSEGAMDYPDPIDKPARTMLTGEGSISRTSHVIADKKTGHYRILTPLECERIQTFPDGWTDCGMTDRQRRFMMGNALVCGIIKRLEPYLSNIFDAEPR